MADPSADLVVVYVTAQEADGERIAAELVASRLAACVNIVPEVRSIYAWNGKIENEREVLLIIKTVRSAFQALATRVRELHPYQLPELIALPVVESSAPYRAWVQGQVGGGAP